MPNAALHEPPEGTEELPGKALVPIQVGANDSAELLVVERTPVRRTVSFMTDVAAEAIGLYLSGPAVDAAQGSALRQALTIRDQLSSAQAQLHTAKAERDQLQNSASETRANLEAVRTLSGAQDLRQRLVRRLGELDARIAELTRTIVGAETTISELRVRLSEALQDVTLNTAP